MRYWHLKLCYPLGHIVDSFSLACHKAANVDDTSQHDRIFEAEVCYSPWLWQKKKIFHGLG